MIRKLIVLLFLGSLAWSQVTVVQSPVPKFRSFLPSGSPNVGGCVYTFASGTSTPLATYVDFTGLTTNSNPVILDANGEAPIWITGSTYRFQVWSFGSGVIGSNCGNGTQLYQIDGIRDTGLSAFTSGPVLIAPTSNGIDILGIIRATDISPTGNFVNFKSFAGASLFKVDVLGNVTASGNLSIGNITAGAGTFSGALSGTTGTFSGGILTLTEVAAPSGAASSDILWADSTAHRLKVNPNNTGAVQLVESGVDINASDQVTQLHFGATPFPLNASAPQQGQFLIITNPNTVSGFTVEITVAGEFNQTLSATTNETANNVNTFFLATAHNLTRLGAYITTAGVTCATAAVLAVKDVTASSNVTTFTIATNPGIGNQDSGPLFIAMTAGHVYAVIVNTAATGCGTSPIGKLWATYQ